MHDSAGTYNLKPPALTDSEYESESDIESDANDDTNGLPDTLPNTIYRIPREKGPSVTGH